MVNLFIKLIVTWNCF